MCVAGGKGWSLEERLAASPFLLRHATCGTSLQPTLDSLDAAIHSPRSLQDQPRHHTYGRGEWKAVAAISQGFRLPTTLYYSTRPHRASCRCDIRDRAALTSRDMPTIKPRKRQVTLPDSTPDGGVVEFLPPAFRLISLRFGLISFFSSQGCLQMSCLQSTRSRIQTVHSAPFYPSLVVSAQDGSLPPSSSSLLPSFHCFRERQLFTSSQCLSLQPCRSLFSTSSLLSY